MFRDTPVRNARTTLVLMASILGAMFLSVSVFAALTTRAVRRRDADGALQIGRTIFGHGTAPASPITRCKSVPP